MVAISAVVSVALEDHHLGISDVYLPEVIGLTDIQTPAIQIMMKFNTTPHHCLHFSFYICISSLSVERLLDPYATDLSFPWFLLVKDIPLDLAWMHLPAKLLAWKS